jgi:hypothetical protein
MNEEKKKEKASAAQVAIMLGRAGAELFCSHDNEPWATFTVNGVSTTCLVNTRRFERWLQNEYFNGLGKTVGGNAVKEAISVLEQQALNSERKRVYKRVARIGDKIFIDLANDFNECIEVTAAGWSVVQAPCKFRRTNNTGDLPYPVAGSVDLLQDMLSTTEDNWALIKGWLLDVFKGHGPYLVLCVSGEPGSSKSYTCRKLKLLADPVKKANLTTLPRDEADFALNSENEHIIAYDNISSINHTQSDAICRISTGAGFKKRTLYANSEQTIYDVSQPQILNGIPDLAEASDLASRAVAVIQPVISMEQRKTEKELDDKFASIRGQVLGGICDLLSQGLKNFDSVSIQYPRQADSIKWITACTGDGLFSDLFAENQEEAVEISMEASPVANALIDLLDTPVVTGAIGGRIKRVGYWRGETNELRDDLIKMLTSNGNFIPDKFPANARALANRLRRDAAALRSVGINGLAKDELRRSNGRKYLVITTAEYRAAHPVSQKGLDASPDEEIVSGQAQAGL